MNMTKRQKPRAAPGSLPEEPEPMSSEELQPMSPDRPTGIDSGFDPERRSRGLTGKALAGTGRRIPGAKVGR